MSSSATAVPATNPATLIFAGLGVAAVAAASWAYAHWGMPWEFLAGDEIEYAEVGRRLASGRGFTTGIIYPIEIGWGVDAEHPSLLRAPLWPALLSLVFRIAEPGPISVQLTSAAAFVAGAVVSFALATRLAGVAVGAVAGVAVATCPDVVLYALFGGTEALFGLWIVVCFALLATGAHGFWIGAVCGLAYLTRFNGGLLLPMACLLLLWRPNRWRAPTACALGFVAVAGIWWTRNALVTGDPFFSLYGITLYFTPDVIPLNGSLLNMIEPDLTSAAAMDPWQKFQRLLPHALIHWPLLTANALGLAGIALACARRDRQAWAFLGVSLATTVVIALVAVRGRYLIPFVPAMLALGAAAWWRYGGALRIPALALLLLMPLLPRLPNELRDTKLAHGFVDKLPGLGPIDPGAAPTFARCVEPHDLVIAFNAPAIHWRANSVTLHMTRTPEDFWYLVRNHPVTYVSLPENHAVVAQERFAETFVARPECGRGIFARR